MKKKRLFIHGAILTIIKIILLPQQLGLKQIFEHQKYTYGVNILTDDDLFLSFKQHSRSVQGLWPKMLAYSYGINISILIILICHFNFSKYSAWKLGTQPALTKKQKLNTKRHYTQKNKYNMPQDFLLETKQPKRQRKIDVKQQKFTQNSSLNKIFFLKNLKTAIQRTNLNKIEFQQKIHITIKQ